MSTKLTLLVLMVLSQSISLNGDECDGNVCISDEQNIHFGTDPFTNWNECYSEESPPNIIAYHIHVAFNGTEHESINFAYKGYHKFIDYIDKNMKMCTFSHSYAASNNEQTDICYFPTPFNENDYPIMSNPILGSSNYAFFVPLSFLQQTLHFWFQNHNDYILHSVTGCQVNDHTKWMVQSTQFSGQFTTNNLLCCHNGPALCTCDIVQYEIGNGKCLGIGNEMFIASECEEPPKRSFGSWREVIYDRSKNYVQIENFGNVTHPIYMCLSVENVCRNGSEIQMKDCSYNQNMGEKVWVSKPTQFMYDKDSNQIRIIGCTDGTLCVNVIVLESDQLKLVVSECQNATIFAKRHFMP